MENETNIIDKKTKIKAIANKILTIFFAIFFLLTLSFTIYFSVMRSQDKPVGLFGYYVCYILTGSMEDTLMVGDVIIIKDTEKQEIKVGDIVTYKSTQGPLSGHYITHRVIEIIEHENDIVQYNTKGDAENTAVDNEFVTYNKILGVYQNKAIILSFLLSILSNFVVFFLLVILPLLVLFALQIKSFVENMKSGEKEETEEE